MRPSLYALSMPEDLEQMWVVTIKLMTSDVLTFGNLKLQLAESAVYNLCDRFQTPRESKVVMTSGAPNATGSFGGYDIKIFFNGAWRRVRVCSSQHVINLG